MVTTALKDGETPFQLWHGKKPDLEHLRVFGCAVYIHIPNSERRKLDKKAQKGRSLFTPKQLAITGYGMR